MAKYLNSIAQKRASFNTDIQYIAEIGDIYWKLMIFCGVTEAADNFIGTAPVAGDVVTLRKNNYTQLVEGTLLDWCASFFGEDPLNTAVLCVVYTDEVEAAWSPADLRLKYAANKYKAYWKCALYSTNDATLELDDLICTDADSSDEKFSQHIVGTGDANCLNDASTTSISYLLTNANSDSEAMLVYHYDTDINPALVALGRSLSFINSTGTSVGNKIQGLKTTSIDSSKDGTDNFTAAEYADLVSQNIGWFTDVSDQSTDGVMLEFDVDNSTITLNGSNVVANWIVNYTNYRTEILAARMLSEDGVFLNAKTYDRMLSILNNELVKFVTLGRLTNYSITAPRWSTSLVSSKTIVVDNAWEATYADDCNAFEVTGTLYINV